MGTTADKLSYLNTTKNYIKESINLTNINITNEPFRYYAYAIKKGIINVLNDPKEIWNNFEKVTGTGTTITLESTADAPMEIDLKGNTSQASEPTPGYPQEIHNVSGDNTIEICGKNLLDMNNALSGYIRTGQVDISSLSGATTYWTKVQHNTTYTMSRDKGNRLIVAGSNTQPALNSSLGAIIYDGGTSTALTYTFNSGNYQYVALYLSKDSNTTPTQVQLEKGNQSSTYTPYVSQTQEIDLRGENIVDISKSQIGVSWNWGSNTARAVVYTKVRPNTKYTISFDTISHLVGIFDFEKVNKEDTTVTSAASEITATKTITTQANSNWLGIQFNKINITLSDIEQVKLMIQEGDTASTYTPYSSLELNKIGNYQDYFYKTDKWYLHKEIGKVVLDGSENNINKVTTKTITQVFEFIDELPNRLQSNDNFYSNYFTSQDGDTEKIVLTLVNIYIAINKTTASSVNELKTWLSTHNTIVYYVLATPTNTEITDSTLIYQLEKTLYSYNGQTNISQTNNDLPFILDVTALEMIE